MSAVAATGSGWLPIRPRWRTGAAVAVSIASAAAFVMMRATVPLPYATLHGACERLRVSGLGVTAQDWFCLPVPWSTRAAFTVASLLMAAGFVIPCVVLAATGRRLTALLPLVLIPLTEFQTVIVSDRWWAGWREGTLEGHLAIALVMAAPVVAVMLARRHGRPRLVTVPVVACAAAWLVVGLFAFGIVRIAKGMYVHHFEILGGTFTPRVLVPGVIAMALFGSLLGTDRRWWPWSLVPVAMLLSAGPSGAIIVGPEGLQDWSGFGAVVPLFAVGLVGSAWRPLAERITRLIRRGDEAVIATFSAAPVTDPGRLRPTTVLNAVGAGLLLVSLVAFRADPLPTRLGVAHPEYLGARTSVEDLRTRQLLHRALSEMDAFEAEHGTYRGFDVAAARSADPALSWQSGLPHGPEGGTRIPELTMGIVTASGTTARLVAVSVSGNAVCIQHDAQGVAYGVEPSRSFGAAVPRAVKRVAAACGSIPWSAAAVRPFPVATLCEGVDRDSGYLICRMVQALMMTSLQRTGPL